MNRDQQPTNQLHNINWGALDHASCAPQLISCNYYLCIRVCVCVCIHMCTSCVCVHTCMCIFVGSCLATKVFIVNLPATEREWFISNSYRVTVCSVRVCVYLLYLFHAAFGKLSCKFVLLHVESHVRVLSWFFLSCVWIT